MSESESHTGFVLRGLRALGLIQLVVTVAVHQVVVAVICCHVE